MKVTKTVRLLSLVISCILLCSFPVSAKNVDLLSLDKIKNQIISDLHATEFNVAEFMQENSDVGQILSVNETVLFDYTQDKATLLKSLSEPVTVYSKVTEVISIPKMQSLVEPRNVTVTRSTKETRTYGGVSVTMDLVLTTYKKNVYSQDMGKYIDVEWGYNTKIKTTNSSSNTWCAESDMFLEQFGTDHYITGSYYSDTASEVRSFSANTGITHTLYSNKAGYVYLGTGGASVIHPSTTLLIMWKTGPGSTTGEYYTISAPIGAGRPS